MNQTNDETPSTISLRVHLNDEDNKVLDPLRSSSKKKSVRNASDTFALSPLPSGTGSSSELSSLKSLRDCGRAIASIMSNEQQKSIALPHLIQVLWAKYHNTGAPIAPSRVDRNFRRRLYDTVNVLDSSGVLRRVDEYDENGQSQSVLYWSEIPNSGSVWNPPTPHLTARHRTLERLNNEYDEKLEKLRRLAEQYASLRTICERNKKRKLKKECVKEHEKEAQEKEERIIRLPFLCFHAHPEAEILCEMNELRTQVFLDFTHPFEMMDDLVCLRHCVYTTAEKKRTRWYQWFPEQIAKKIME